MADQASRHGQSAPGQSIRSPLNTHKVVRSQQITSVVSPTDPSRHHGTSLYEEDDDDDDDDEEEEEEEEEDEEPDENGDNGDDDDEIDAMETAPPIPRSHTPGHLATKNHDRRRKPSELSIRERSQSQSASNQSISPPHPSSVPPSSASTSKTTLLSITTPSTASATPTSSRSLLHPHRSSGGLNGSSDHSPATSAPPRDRPDAAAPEKEHIVSAASRRTPGLRSTSAIASKPGGPGSAAASTTAPSGTAPCISSGVASAASSVRKEGTARGSSSGRSRHNQPAPTATHTDFPPLIDPRTAPDVPPAPASGMYWSRAPVSGAGHTTLRAHTTTLVGSNVFVFGGCDSRACFNQLYVLDADSFHWSIPHVVGDIPVPLRAMTCTAVGKKLVIFGGGDGPAYYNDVHVLDTVNFRWSKPRIVGDRVPSKRRAHTACLYKNGIYVFGGGDGVRALNDIWRLDVSDMNKMSWRLVSGPSTETSPASGTGGKSPSNGRDLRPKARGYHTANMVGGKLIIFGGSDGGECFNDVWVYDVENSQWRSGPIPVTHRRLSHTATIVGSYLFVVGGHDGNEYSNDVLLLNLVTMTWDRRRVYGLPPSGRGYHGTVLHDSRLLVIGGFDGSEVFGEVWVLELAVHAYFSQISHFSIEV